MPKGARTPSPPTQPPATLRAEPVRRSHRGGKVPIGWTILGVCLFSLGCWWLGYLALDFIKHS